MHDRKLNGCRRGRGYFSHASSYRKNVASARRVYASKRGNDIAVKAHANAMAEVPVNRPVPCGYNEEFVDPPDDDLLCIICFLPSKEPVLTRCGHHFCSQCLEEHMRRY